MASIRKEVIVDVPPDAVWAALSDWGRPHERLVPGFVVDARLEGDDRIVEFFDGAVMREVLLGSDDRSRRLAWSIVDGPYSHHNGSAQAIPDGDGTRFVWIADLLPDSLAAPTAAMMERGVGVVKETLEAAAAGAESG